MSAFGVSQSMDSFVMTDQPNAHTCPDSDIGERLLYSVLAKGKFCECCCIDICLYSDIIAIELGSEIL